MDNEADVKARGVRLKAARELKGLSQEQAALELGVSRVSVSGWENGAPISEDRISGIAQLYGVGRAWIRYGEGVAPEGLAGGRRANPTTDAVAGRTSTKQKRKDA